jgi:hypothetical protein
MIWFRSLPGDHRPRGGGAPAELPDDLVEHPPPQAGELRKGGPGQDVLEPGGLLGPVEDTAQGEQSRRDVRRQREDQGADVGVAGIVVPRGRHAGADHVAHVVGGLEVVRPDVERLPGGRGEEELTQQ